MEDVYGQGESTTYVDGSGADQRQQDAEQDGEEQGGLAHVERLEGCTFARLLGLALETLCEALNWRSGVLWPVFYTRPPCPCQRHVL